MLSQFPQSVIASHQLVDHAKESPHGCSVQLLPGHSYALDMTRFITFHLHEFTSSEAFMHFEHIYRYSPRNVISEDPTGSGKTLAFAVGAIAGFAASLDSFPMQLRLFSRCVFVSCMSLYHSFPFV
jgi:Rad3-related DNA helicase